MILTPLKRIVLQTIAVTSLVTAIWLLFWSGLPNHADYSGFGVYSVGYVAPEIGEIAPPIDTNTLSGEHFHLEDMRGESVIINFWATWCVPCAIEMPELQTLHEETGIRVLAVNIAEPQSTIQSWVDDFELTFDILLDPQQTIYRQYRIIGQPTTLVIAPDGIITHIFYGSTTADTLQTAISTHEDNG